MERDMQEAVAGMRFEDAAKLRGGIKPHQKVFFFVLFLPR
jgi:excinuclease UvrABC nuclease subunit